MMSLKKYFMEGLIQVAILLSLCRVQEEVGLEPYLPPSLQEILLGHTSALTPTQSHHLRHHGPHPKTVDLDSFFTARRLLGFGHSLDRLQVPQVELEAWLVQQDPGPLTLPRGSPDPTSLLERPAAGTRGIHTPPLMELQVGPVNQEEEEEEEQVVHRSGSQVHRGEDLNRRSSSEGGGGPGGSSGHINTENQADQTAGSLQECLRLLEETFPFREEQVNEAGGRMEDLQCPSVDRLPSLSRPEDLETRWQDLVSIMEQEDTDTEMESLQHVFNSASSRSAEAGGPEDLMTETRDGSLLVHGVPTSHGFTAHPEERMLPLIPSTELDDHSSSMVSKASLTNNPFHSPPDHRNLLEEDSSQDFSPDLNTGNNSFHMGLLTPDAMHLMVLETPSEVEVNFHSCLQTPSNLDDEADGLLSDLLENTSVLEEMRLLDTTLGKGFSPEMAVRLEEEGFFQQELSPEETGSTDDHVFINQAPPEQRHQEIMTGTESDSGLSLDFAHSPASPGVSQVSSYSSSSSSVSSSSSCMSAGGSPFTEYEDDEAEESLVGSDMELEMTIKQEDLEEEEMGAVGGGYPGDTKELLPFKPENHKLFQDSSWMERIDHDHTYNQPWTSTSPSSALKMTNKHIKSEGPLHSSKPYHRSFSNCLSESKLWSRDERRARTLRIPFSNDLIVNLPVEEFNDLLTKYDLNEDQMNLIKDIRRRGKNKIAAQNCRKRKQDVLLGLDDDVSGLRRHRLQLLKEKEEALRALQEMRQRLRVLYQEVFSRLRDEGGNPLDNEEYLIEFGPDRTIIVASHHNEAAVPPTGRKSSRKQDKKK